MKIRTDFVTNSSSSSYIVAFKGLPKIDQETIDRYPFLESYQKIVKEAIYGGGGSYETTEADEFENLLDLQRYFINEYGYRHESFQQLCKEDSYVNEMYQKCAKKMEEGYKILTKNIGYDDYREDLFIELESDDFIILTKDEV